MGYKSTIAAACTALSLAAYSPVPAQAGAGDAVRLAQATYVYSCVEYSNPRQFFLVYASSRGSFRTCELVGFSLAEAYGRVCYYLSAGTSTPSQWPQYGGVSMFGIGIPICP